MKRIAIIPAKANSSRLPNKNKKLFCGKPLVCWTIEAAVSSEVFDDIIVSTDCLEIANLARNYLAVSVVERPENISDEYATSVDVINHCLANVKKKFRKQEFDLCYLQPTSPLRTFNDIRDSSNLMRDENILNVVSICETAHPKEWTFRLSEDLNLSEVANQISLRRSQDYPPTYTLNGAIYWIKLDHFKKHQSLITKQGSIGYKMPTNRSIDIDTLEDFVVAEALMSART